MTEFHSLGRSVGDYLAGNLAGQRAVDELRHGLCDQDFLYRLARKATPELDSDYVRGLLRAVQKAVEREAAHG